MRDIFSKKSGVGDFEKFIETILLLLNIVSQKKVYFLEYLQNKTYNLLT